MLDVRVGSASNPLQYILSLAQFNNDIYTVRFMEFCGDNPTGMNRC